jgi:hypothetical protein
MDYPGKVITKNQVTPTQTSATGVWTLDDAAAATRNNNWPVAGVPNPISKSLRFNSADSAYLNRTPASTSNRQVWTYSAWVKRSSVAASKVLLGATGSSRVTYIWFNASNQLGIYSATASGGGDGGEYVSSAIYRDPGAWYHIVVAYDSTQATSTNRIKAYVNGSQITAWATSTAPTLNHETQYNWTGASMQLGAYNTGSFFDGYLTEVNLIDGQQLTPSSFGMTDPTTGVWEPLKYSGTYGTNGFYLNFKDATSTTTLGYDYSGNANNWTTNNFSVTAGVGNDSMTDVPTPWVAYNTGDSGGVIRGNYCTLNPLQNTSVTLSNGNLQATYAPGSWVSAQATMPIPKTGKWKYEVTPTTMTYGFIAIVKPSSALTGTSYQNTNNYAWYLDSGEIRYSGTNLITVTAASANDICEVRVDNGTVSFYRNGTLQYTFTQLLTDISDDYFPAVYVQSGAVHQYNFGQRPFTYTVPGFLSLCTTNLPASTVLKGSDYFNAVLWTGNSTASQAITGVGFQPDLVWAKSRPANSGQDWVDAVRGATKNIQSNSTAAETTSNTVISFQSDGFTVGDGLGYDINKSGESVVGWCWNAGGSTVTNTSGTISAQVRANTTAGFSIVTYTGNGIDGATVGHGLGVVPSMIIQKRRDGSIANWRVWHSAIYATSGVTDTLFLNSTAASGADVDNISGVSSTTFTTRGTGATNPSGNGCVAYVFAAISGFSAFGKYTGNGSADGPFVYLGFRPRFVLIKNATDTGGNAWLVFDTARDTYNVTKGYLAPNNSNAENTASSILDMTSNGFKLRDSFVAWNGSGNTIVYACFAENPFKNALAR